MEHFQIAYDLGIIFIGLAALSIAFFLASRTEQGELKIFCLLYSLYTLVLVILVLKKYLSLNVDAYPVQAWFYLSGFYQILSYAVIVAAIYYFLVVYQIRAKRTIILGFLLLMLLSSGLILSPLGAVLDLAQNTIHLGLGYKIASSLYLFSFTFVLVLGYGLIGRIWNTVKRTFILGLLLFATTGYVETFINFLQVLRNPIVTISAERNFLFSSIPYALYGIFLIIYFLRYPVPTVNGLSAPSEDFLKKYGITKREGEIILKVVQGKSNAAIASELFLSIATVKTHLHNIYKKTGVDGRYALLARVRSEQ